jgi:hypothetical protein
MFAILFLLLILLFLEDMVVTALFSLSFIFFGETIGLLLKIILGEFLIFSLIMEIRQVISHIIRLSVDMIIVM